MSAPLKRLFSIVTIFLICSSLYPQKSGDKLFIKSMREADVFFYYDADYEKASDIYETLLASNPGHQNLQSKLGTCYLSMDGKRVDALNLLKAASSNIVTKENEFDDLEVKAPLDTYIYLGLAYQLNDSLDKAIEILTDAKVKLANTDLFRNDFIDNQIANCRYAIEMIKNPLHVDNSLLVDWLANYPGSCNPVFSENGLLFFFTQVTETVNKIFVSTNNNGWSLPQEITQQLGNYDRLFTNSVTANGDYLVLSMDNQGDGNLFFSEIKGENWTKAKSIGKQINTVYWESHGFIVPDGKTLYFSSNRNGGRGDLDIWVSKLSAEGEWGTPSNLGSVINTGYNEDTPYFDIKNNALFFSSAGHVGMGDYDVFVSYYNQNKWSNPVGIPYSFNNTAPNVFFVPLTDTVGYITALYDENVGSKNIYKSVGSKIEPKIEFISVEGTITLGDDMEFIVSKASMNIVGADSSSAITIDTEGKFKIDLLPGSYTVNTNYGGYEELETTLEIPEENLGSYISFNPVLTPLAVTSGSYLEINNILFGFDSFELSLEATEELDKLISVLHENPELKVEIAGFTDAIGSTDYNINLSRKRVGSAVNYLTNSGRIDKERLIQKAYGETNFIAVNRNMDGSDNSEGRAYNRRVTIGIVDPQTGTTIHLEPFTPENLRLRSSMKYSVVLQKSRRPLPDSNFGSLNYSGKQFFKPILSDNVCIYTVGLFFSAREAGKFLDYAIEQGFSDAFIINQYEIAQELVSVERVSQPKTVLEGRKKYTIQLLATRNEADKSVFGDLVGVEAIEGDDGYIRYIYGGYDTLSQTKTDLSNLREKGFKDAFVKEVIDL